MTETAHYKSPLGEILIAADGGYLTGLWFTHQKHFPSHLPAPTETDTCAVLSDTKNWLDTYFRGTQPDFTPPIKPRGTQFQETVWHALQTIPYGQTTTYGAIATQCGFNKNAARAIAAAIGRNPISIIIPCHRVLGANGKLTGYAGGIDRKKKLLTCEHINNFLI